MKILIPMAGTGQRFVDVGYEDPKPLIKVNGRRIMEYVCDMFDKDSDEFVFICNDKHLSTTNMREVLGSLVNNYKIIPIQPHKKGPVFTILDSACHIDDDEEVIVCYCDNPYLWDYAGFKKWVKDNKSDGCILSHTGFHPHRLSPTMMAYIQQKDLVLSAIKEKACYTSNPMEEHASTGTYYFRRGEYIKKYFQMLVDENINYNGEYYVTLVYNLLVRDGLLVHSYPTDYVTVFGTPEEVKNFEAWQVIMRQIKNEDDLVKCYRYWKGYNETYIPQG